MFPIAAGLGALSYLTSLLKSSTANTGTTQGSNPLAQLGQALDADGDGDQSKSASVGSGGTTPPYNANMLSNLLALQSQDGSGPQSGLFAKLDTNGDGQLSRSELAAAHHGHHHHGGAGGLASLLNSNASGATTQTATNADGSTTTTITYSDGSTVSMTMATASASDGASGNGSSGDGSAGGGSGTSQVSLIEQLIKLQSQFLTQSGSTVSTTA